MLVVQIDLGRGEGGIGRRIVVARRDDVGPAVAVEVADCNRETAREGRADRLVQREAAMAVAEPDLVAAALATDEGVEMAVVIEVRQRDRIACDRLRIGPADGRRGNGRRRRSARPRIGRTGVAVDAVVEDIELRSPKSSATPDRLLDVPMVCATAKVPLPLLKAHGSARCSRGAHARVRGRRPSPLRSPACTVESAGVLELAMVWTRLKTPAPALRKIARPWLLALRRRGCRPCRYRGVTSFTVSAPAP